MTVVYHAAPGFFKIKNLQNNQGDIRGNNSAQVWWYQSFRWDREHWRKREKDGGESGKQREKPAFLLKHELVFNSSNHSEVKLGQHKETAERNQRNVRQIIWNNQPRTRVMSRRSFEMPPFTADRCLNMQFTAGVWCVLNIRLSGSTMILNST